MITFDDSLGSFASGIAKVLGIETLSNATILRDATGKLTLVLAQMPSDAEQQQFSRLAADLTPYVDASLAFATAEDLGFDSLANARTIVVRVNGVDLSTHLLDQRIVGYDWTSQPAPGWRVPAPARFVFWSLKGGVGRTTALCVAASHLANQGRRVLALDLDLEAPGLASVTLEPENLPSFGSLDWFVENGLQGLDDSFLDSLIAPSAIGGAATFDVVPAVGKESRNNPQNVIPKLGRAYIDDILSSGQPQTFLAQTADLVQRLLDRGQYDTLLVDARAGLNETTPASILGLGADILMFGTNTVQTFEGYRYLLSYLRDLPIDPDDDWRLRLKMVYAKADIRQSQKIFHDRSFALFSEFLYEEQTGADGFNFDLDDPDAPHYPWAIADDTNFRDFDPLNLTSLLSERVYDVTFGELLDGIQERTEITE